MASTLPDLDISESQKDRCRKGTRANHSDNKNINNSEPSFSNHERLLFSFDVKALYDSINVDQCLHVLNSCNAISHDLKQSCTISGNLVRCYTIHYTLVQFRGI